MRDYGLERMRGPFFDFLVCEKDSYWERRGRVQRIVGIKSEFFHHPDALRLQDSVVALVIDCFRQANERFHFTGDTIYEADNLDQLAGCLETWVERVRGCETEEEFTAMLTDGFVQWGLMRFRSWRKHWPKLRDDIAEGLTSIVQRARAARAEDKVLLVLGV